MKIILKDSKVLATHGDDQEVLDLYPDCTEIIVPDDTEIDYYNGTYVVTASADDIKKAKKKELASARFRSEVGGVTYGEHIIATDRESRSMLFQYAYYLGKGTLTEVDWKCPGSDSYVTLDKHNIDEVVILVLTHISTVFAAEKAAIEAL